MITNQHTYIVSTLNFSTNKKMHVFNIPYSHNFCKCVAQFVVKQHTKVPFYDSNNSVYTANSNINALNASSRQHTSQLAHRQCITHNYDTIVVVPTKAVKGVFWHYLNNERKNAKGKLRIICCDELHRYTDIFALCNTHQDTFFNSLGNEVHNNHNKSSYLFRGNNTLDKRQFSILLDPLLNTIITAQPQFQESKYSLLGIKNRLLDAIFEYYQYNINIHLLQNSFDINENFLYQAITQIEHFLTSHKCTLEPKYMREVSNHLCEHLASLTVPLRWRIFFIPPVVGAPYIDDIIVAFYKYLTNLDSQYTYGGIIFHGMDITAIHNTKRSCNNNLEQQYAYQNLIEALNLGVSDIVNIVPESELDKQIQRIVVSPNIAQTQDVLEEHVNFHHISYIQNYKELSSVNANPSSLSYSVVSYPNRYYELYSVSEYIVEYLTKNSNHSIYVTAADEVDCDRIWHYIKTSLGIYDNECNANLKCKLYTHIKYSLADRSPTYPIFIQTLEYCDLLAGSQHLPEAQQISIQQDILKKWFQILFHPTSIFYKKYGEALHYLEEFFYSHLLSLKYKSVEQMLNQAICDTLHTAEGNNNTKKSVYADATTISQRIECFQMCVNFTARLTEFYEYVISNEEVVNTLELHLSVISYLLQHSNDHGIQQDIEKIRKLVAARKKIYLPSFSTAKNIYTTANNAIHNLRVYKECLHSTLHERVFCRNKQVCEQNKAFNIVIGTPRDLLYRHYDLIIATHMEEGKFPKPYNDHSFISPITKQYIPQYRNRSAFERGYWASCFSNLLASTHKILFTCSSTSITHSKWVELLLAHTAKSSYVTQFSATNGNQTLYQDHNCTYHTTTYTKHSTRVTQITAHPVTHNHALPPTPPLAVRPLILSATAIEKLLTNPYVFYIQYILRLGVDAKRKQSISLQREFGVFVHKIMYLFSTKYRNSAYKLSLLHARPQYLTRIKDIALKELGWEKNCIPQYQFWSIKADRIILWWYEHHMSEQNNDWKYLGEYKIEDVVSLHSSTHPPLIKYTAVLDQLMINSGKSIAHVIDYKTGNLPSINEISSGYKPQLALQHLLLTKFLNRDHHMFSLTNTDTLPIIKASYIHFTGWKKLAAKEKEYTFDTANIENELKKIVQMFYVDLLPYSATDIFYEKQHIHLARTMEFINM